MNGTTDTHVNKTCVPRSNADYAQEQALPRGDGSSGEGECAELALVGPALTAVRVNHTEVMAGHGVRPTSGQSADQIDGQADRQANRVLNDSTESRNLAVEVDNTAAGGAMPTPETGLPEGLYSVMARAG